MIGSNAVPRQLVRWTVAGAALALLAGANLLLARRANRLRPPAGRFIHVRGERIHYVDRGEGKPLVLLHGNGSAVQDFIVSGLLERCAVRHRVIALDRPGFGHSSRSTRALQRPERQADLVADSLRQLDVSRAVIFAHSWGTLVALSLALRHPERVAAVVLASGYYFPAPRPDVLPFSLGAVPAIGDVFDYTIAPLIGRIGWPLLMNRLFAPAPVSKVFSQTLKPLALRPAQQRATAQDTAAMIPAAERLSSGYGSVRVPATIIAGRGDRIVSAQQSERLQREMRIARLQVISGAGHMVHHSAVDEVVDAIDRSMIHAVAA